MIVDAQKDHLTSFLISVLYLLMIAQKKGIKGKSKKIFYLKSWKKEQESIFKTQSSIYDGTFLRK